MKKIDRVISDATKLCHPGISTTDKLKSVSGKVMEKIEQAISYLAHDKIIGLYLGGSYAKGTWLPEDMDLDFFVKFDPSISKLDFEDLGVKVGLLALRHYNPYLRYSEHPYVEAHIDDIRINIVPCYDVKQGNWISAADRSPFHTTFMREKLSDDMRCQVRILKLFLKSIGIYGAQISVAGFSGYITEILILKYGSFLRVIESIASLNREKYVISINNSVGHSVDGIMSKIVVMDPVDDKRNLGAAISANSLGKFILAARSFLENPRVEYFKKLAMNLDVKIISQLRPNLLVVEFHIRKRSPDILWGQLNRSLRALVRQLDLSGFNAISSTCTSDETKYAAFIFLIEFTRLPAFSLRIGPEILRRQETEHFFLNKNSVPFWIDRNMKVLTISKRKTTDVKEYVTEILSSNASGVGLNKDIAADLKLGYDVYGGAERELSGSIVSALGKLMINDKRFINSQREGRY